jgi:hypothetical protein
MWPETVELRRWLTGVTLCVGAGSLTYHLARLYGTEDPISLAVMVILAELFLGACVVLGILITTRMSETLFTDAVHEVTPQGAPAVWAPKAPRDLTPADRRMQTYLRRVLSECEGSKGPKEARRAMGRGLGGGSSNVDAA